MSTQVDPAHNLNALLIGTGEFSFSEGATSAANAQVRGWLDFGNMQSFSVEPDITKEEHVGSYRGVRRTDKTVVTKQQIKYKLKLDEFNLKNVERMFGGSSTTGHTQAIISAVAGETFGFTANPGVIGKWYDIKKSTGARLRNLTSVTMSIGTEGTNFVLDLKMARIKFLTAQASDNVPTITCAAIVAGDAYSFLGITPLLAPVLSGYGKLIVFDQYSSNIIVMEHENFSCDVSLDGNAEINGTGFSELSLDILVTDTVGTVLTRYANQNAGI